MRGHNIFGKEGWFTMSVSAETYIVISLMFAVFAAVAAVGTSIVLGAGFERLRAGFDLVKRQSGFFADAIHKLDQRTQKLDEETSRLKAGVYSMGERVDRVEKQTTFMAEAVNSLEQRILQGNAGAQAPAKTIRMHAVHTVSRAKPQTQQESWISKPPVQEQAAQPSLQTRPLISGMFHDDFDAMEENVPETMHCANDTAEPARDESSNLTSLLSRYLSGEQSGSGKGVVYH